MAAKFGLAQQGRIETIKKVLNELGSNEYAWQKIGKEIGWDPMVSCYQYVKYLRENDVSNKILIECIKKRKESIQKFSDPNASMDSYRAYYEGKRDAFQHIRVMIHELKEQETSQ